MQIFIKILISKIIVLKVEFLDIINQIKTKIQDKKKIFLN